MGGEGGEGQGGLRASLTFSRITKDRSGQEELGNGTAGGAKPPKVSQALGIRRGGFSLSERYQKKRIADESIGHAFSFQPY